MNTATKEKPIIFSAPMVKAILDGRKTQHRIPLNPQPRLSDDGIWKVAKGRSTFVGGYHRNEETGETQPYSIKETAMEYCRNLGRVGDLLWVKETWEAYEPQEQRFGGKGVLAGAMVRMKAHPPYEGCEIKYKADQDTAKDFTTYRSSVHMPRWASRLTLEITDIRVQRLQEISVKEVFAEGVQIPVSATGSPMLQITGKCSPDDYLPEGAIEKGTLKLKDKTAYIRAHFASLWDTINGKGSWVANPWVFALTFRRVES